MSQVFQGRFHRVDGWSECDGIRYEQKGRAKELVYPLCRALVNAGHPDGKLELFDERGMHCMTVASIHKGATLCISEGDNGIHTVKWIPFDERGNMASLAPTYISQDWYDALSRIISEGKPVFDALHGKTRNAFVDREYVLVLDDQIEVMDAGLEAMAEFEAAKAAGKIKAAEAVTETEDTAEIAHKSDDVDLPYLVTTKQREAFQIAQRGDATAWNALHGKTSNFMLRQGWVKLNGDKPVVTEAGMKVATAFEILKAE